MNSLLETLRGLGALRLGAMAATAAALIAFFIYMTGRLAGTEQSLLYSDLSSQDSGQIITRLEQLNVPYQLGGEGNQIYVPGDQVARLRMTMAEEGLPSDGSMGYEIFDQTDGLGTTNFMQNINHLRALEGELARTITSIENVRQARVHLVMPRRELFSRERQEPSASIVLAMRGNFRLDRQQVLAIQHLVAAAVPDLKPNMISIIDDKGSLLARGGEEGDLSQLTSNAEEMRVAYETRLVRTIEDLLERSLGVGNVRAQVSAEMDFDRITENAEIYDPESQVVRSTQVVEEESDSTEGQPPAVTVGNNLPDANLPPLEGDVGSQARSSRTEETVNYEISRTVKTHVRETGVTRRLSVAVMVNGSYNANEAGDTVYVPRSAEELERIEALVRSAVGFDENRGDTIEIVNLQFTDPLADYAEPEGFFGMQRADLMRIAEIIVLGLIGMMVLLLIVRPLVLQFIEASTEASQATTVLPDGTIAGPALAMPGAEGPELIAVGADGQPVVRQLTDGEEDGEPSIAQEIDQMIDINQVEGRVRASSIRKIGEIIQSHPEEAVQIIRSWLYQVN